MTTITIPGAVYYDALDPNCSTMAHEIGLPAPSTRRFGRGLQFRYADVSAEQATEVAEYIAERAEMLLGGGDPDDPERGTYRAAIRASEKIRQQIAAEARS